MNSINYWLIAWIAIAVVSAIVEAVTVSIVSCWFTVGAIFAIGAYFLGANSVVQFIVFVVVSGVSLIIARPIIKKHNKTEIQPTNADMLVGKEAIVTETIDNISGSGAVKINGLEWTAKSDDNSEISKGEIVKILKIEGVKLIVTKTEKGE